MRARSTVALSAAGLSKRFGATKALEDASLDLGAGEVHALLGENGSGKSTFAKILAGIHRSDSGTIERAGQRVDIADLASARSLGIGIVFQELSLAPDLSVVDNLFLAREKASLGWLDRKSELSECNTILRRLDLELDPLQPVRTLTIAQKQMLEVAKALLLEPAILILDEPTASLTEHEIGRLFEFIVELRSQKVAILYITHHLREVIRIANRVSVLRDGRTVAQQKVDSQTTEDMLLSLLTEKRVAEIKTKATPPVSTQILSLSSVRTENCQDVSIVVRPGEIVGLYGVVGCGREEIARIAVGLHRQLDGVVELFGKPYRPKDPAVALRYGVGFLGGDRKEDGTLPSRPIRENLTLSNLRRFARKGWLRLRLERNSAAAQLRNLRVKYAFAEDPISMLSGGNQQKVLLGRALSISPKLLILEDPTSGIDVAAKRDLYDQIRSYSDAGTGFLWLSTDVTETLLLCHRVYAMRAGRIVDEIENPTLADEGRLLGSVLGGGPRE
jgi:ABC-type sugar transport system ATPase subunit